MTRRKSKKPRGSRGFRPAPCLQDRVIHQYLDLFVPLPKSSSAAEDQIQSQLLLSQVKNRLADTGYSTAAVAHTIYGRPKPGIDDPKTVFPASFPAKVSKGEDEGTKRPGKRRRTELETNSKKPPLRVLRRLHAVIENLSDMGAYAFGSPQESGTKGSSISALLDEYDVVSVSPRNDATFQAACVSATAADIVTLDYTSGRGGVQLPFRIRPADVRAIVERCAVLEIPYSSALLHLNQRKALVQTARELQMASVGIRPKPRIIFCSGDRTMGDTDVGAMALRSPGDLINLLQTVLRFDQTTAYDALSASGTAVLTRAQQRRSGGKEGYIQVGLCVKAEKSSDKASSPSEGSLPQNVSTPANNENKSEEMSKSDASETQDGFITLT